LRTCVDEIVAAAGADFSSAGAKTTKAAVNSSAVQTDNMAAANIKAE
jgi:hypothetical protein